MTLESITQAGIDERELRTVVQRLARRIRAERSDGRFSDLQVALLFSLDHSGPRTPRHLAERERVTPQSINRTVNALEEAGLVARGPSGDDGRCVLVSITDAGREYIGETTRLRNAWIADRLSRLTGEERALVRAALPVLKELAEA